MLSNKLGTNWDGRTAEAVSLILSGFEEERNCGSAGSVAAVLARCHRDSDVRSHPLLRPNTALPEKKKLGDRLSTIMSPAIQPPRLPSDVLQRS